MPLSPKTHTPHIACCHPARSSKAPPIHWDAVSRVQSSAVVYYYVTPFSPALPHFITPQQEPSHWDAISRGGLDRIQSRYTWRIYASRLMTLTRVYSFWRHVTNLVGPAT